MTPLFLPDAYIYGMAAQLAEAEIGGYYYDGQGVPQLGGGRPCLNRMLMIMSLLVTVYVCCCGGGGALTGCQGDIAAHRGGGSHTAAGTDL